jgi:hypothetical protein
MCAYIAAMKSIRSSRPAARNAAKSPAAKRTTTVTAAKKASGGTAAKKAGASLRDTARVSSAARAELNGILERVHHNIDDIEALLAD